MANTGFKSRQRLTALTRIVREVDSAPDLDNALRLLVRRTREVMGADVCTVYVTDEAKRRHVVAATDGLSSRIVGNLQFGFGKGLIDCTTSSRPQCAGGTGASADGCTATRAWPCGSIGHIRPRVDRIPIFTPSQPRIVRAEL